MKSVIVLSALLLFAGGAWASDDAARAKLIGAWQPQDPSVKEAWNLESKGKLVRITHSMGDETLAEFECNTMGRECSGKESGKSAKISLWFNGSKLVALETRGHEVVKRRFAVAEEGDILEIESIPIVPSGKTETMHLRRVQQQ